MPLGFDKEVVRAEARGLMNENTTDDAMLAPSIESDSAIYLEVTPV